MGVHMTKPRFFSIPRLLGVLAVFFWSCCSAGSYRTTGFGFEMEVIWGQLFMSLLLTAPACLMVTAGLSLLRRLGLVCLVTIATIAFGQVHAALQEGAVLRKHGEHPATRLIVHRWFPYGQSTMRYEPELGIWIGDD